MGFGVDRGGRVLPGPKSITLKKNPVNDPPGGGGLATLDQLCIQDHLVIERESDFRHPNLHTPSVRSLRFLRSKNNTGEGKAPGWGEGPSGPMDGPLESPGRGGTDGAGRRGGGLEGIKRNGWDEPPFEKKYNLFRGAFGLKMFWR